MKHLRRWRRVCWGAALLFAGVWLISHFRAMGWASSPARGQWQSSVWLWRGELHFSRAAPFNDRGNLVPLSPTGWTFEPIDVRLRGVRLLPAVLSGPGANTLVIPLLLPAVGSALAAYLCDRGRGRRQDSCAICGYSLRGNVSGRCSECGSKIR